MNATWVLVVEGPSDERRLRGLLAATGQAAQPVGLTAGRSFTAIKDVPRVAQALRLPPVHGRFDHGDERNLRQALQVVRKLQRDGAFGDRVVLIWGRDTDGDLGRRQVAAAIQAHLAEVGGAVLVRAVAHRCGEAWCVAGATHPQAQRARADLRGALGFDPVLAPARLSAKPAAPRPDAKQALEALTDGDLDVELECLLRAWADALGSPVGEEIGLADLRRDLEALAHS
jgi:hypothetical protein